LIVTDYWKFAGQLNYLDKDSTRNQAEEEKGENRSRIDTDRTD